MNPRQNYLDLDKTAPAKTSSFGPADLLMEKSAEALSDTDLLALVLAPRLAVGDPCQLAADLLHREGSLNRLARMPVPELMRLPGVGRATACALHSALALANRMRHGDPRSHPRLIGPSSVADYFAGYFLNKDQEEFHALLLDTKNRLLRDELITIGLIDRSQVHAREVFRRAIRESCSRILLAHNHPSGDPTPSAQDIAATRSLHSAGEIVGIEVIDHIIIGTPDPRHPKAYVSMKEENLM